MLRRRRRGDRRRRAALTNVPWLVDTGALAERTGIAAMSAAERPRGAGLRRPRAGAGRTGGTAAGGRERGRQRGRHRRGHRPRRGDAAQRRRPIRACRVGGRARRLRAAHDARAADDRSADEDLRPRQRRARRLRARAWSTSISSRTTRSDPALSFTPQQRRAEKAVRRRRARCATRPTCRPGSAAAALEHRCPLCVEAMDMFVDAYGRKRATWRSATSRPAASTSAAGSRRRSCPRSSPARSSTRSARRAACAISSRQCPSSVILNPDAGLIGAAVHAIAASAAE